LGDQVQKLASSWQHGISGEVMKGQPQDIATGLEEIAVFAKHDDHSSSSS